MKRLSFDEYFISLAFVASLRSEDLKRKVGAICANKQNQIVATGYNGFAPGVCAQDVLTGDDTRRRQTIFHAEQNALLLCPRGSVHTLAVTVSCCSDCARLAANHGVKRVVFARKYPDTAGIDLLKFYGVETVYTPLPDLTHLLKINDDEGQVAVPLA